MHQSVAYELLVYARKNGLQFEYYYDELLSAYKFIFRNPVTNYKWTAMVDKDKFYAIKGPTRLLADMIIKEFEKEYSDARI